jgi:hypothetical protein
LVCLFYFHFNFNFTLFLSQANNIFPEKWKVDERLCEEFCFATRTQIGEILEKSREDNLLTVDEIVTALTKTGMFMFVCFCNVCLFVCLYVL